MFCKKCGASVKDRESFCPVCGAEARPSSPQANRGLGKIPKGAVVGTVLLVVALVGFFAFTGLKGGTSQGTPEKTVESLVSAMASSDFKGALDYFPEQLLDVQLEKAGMTKEEFSEKLSSSLGSAVGLGSSIVSEQMFKAGYASLEDLLADFTIAVEITSTEHCDQKELESIISKFTKYAGEPQDEITDAAHVSCEITVSGELDGEPKTATSEQKYTLIKMSGKWYIFST